MQDELVLSSGHRRAGRRFVLIALLALLLSGVVAASAFGATKTWLDWVWTANNGHQYGATQNHVYQVAAEPYSYKWGCANIWDNGVEFFTYYYCGSPGSQGETPYVDSCSGCRPEVWNDSSKGQDMWGWEDYG